MLLLIGPLFAREEYKLELGLAMGSLYYPSYMGSKSIQILTAPLPYIRYRGEVVTIDEDGLSSKLFGINGLRLDMSLNGSLPASSDSDGAREGMPNLDLTGEIGPKLVYNLYEKGVALLEFELPIRATLSTDFSSITYRGIVSNPQFKYSLNYSEFEWSLRVGAIFSDSVYNDYYYGVVQKYVTSQRAEYKTQSGFSGLRHRVGMSYKKNRWWAGAFVSYSDISGATFRDSPLVETTDALYMGVSVAYIFYTTK
jgi:outer membrane scaffolding protein for murein synthesis (MipA/OmpV family)